MIKKQTKYEVLTPGGWKDFDGVQILNGERKLFKIITEQGSNIEVTDNHKIKTITGFKEVKDIVCGEQIFTQNGIDIIKFITSFVSDTKVYDLLDVKEGNEYYTNGIVSHNCQFLGSSGTLISGAKLKELFSVNPIHKNDQLCQYEQPIKGNSYVMTVDVSRGKGLDYSTFSVFDVMQMPYKQVCVFRDNLMGPADFSSVIYRFGKFYNEASTLIEINDNGQQVADILLYDFGYENLLFTESAGRSGKRISGGFGKNVDRGIRTTKTVKAIGTSMLKMLIEQNQLLIFDHHTIEELKTFSRKGISYEAESGKHDDLVMNLVLFAWLTDQAFFKEITDINTLARLREKTEEEIEQDLLPFGFIDDGSGDAYDIPNVEVYNWGAF